MEGKSEKPKTAAVFCLMLTPIMQIILVFFTKIFPLNKEKTEESEQKVYITSKNEISKCKNFAILDFNFKDVDRFKTFYNISKEEGGLYVHSLSEPFNEEMEFSFKRMKNWLNYFNLKFFQSHCSGHASGPELKEIIKKNKTKSFVSHSYRTSRNVQKIKYKICIDKRGKEI